MKIDTSLMFGPATVSEMAGELEDAGFDGAYSFEGQSDPFITLTAAAMKTKKMDLMTSIAVALAPHQSPWRTENISGGCGPKYDGLCR